MNLRFSVQLRSSPRMDEMKGMRESTSTYKSWLLTIIDLWSG